MSVRWQIFMDAVHALDLSEVLAAVYASAKADTPVGLFFSKRPCASVGKDHAVKLPGQRNA